MLSHLSAALLLPPRRLLSSSPRTLTRACSLLRGSRRMEPAVVRCLPGEPKLTISFRLDGSNKHMLRDQDEALGKVLSRISNNIAKGQGKAKKKTKRIKGQQPSCEAPEPTVVKLYCGGGGGGEVADTVLNSEAWQDGAKRAHFTNAELPASLMAEFPVCPNLELEFGSSALSFLLFSSCSRLSPEAAAEAPAEDGGWTEVGCGRVHVPSNQDIGHRLKLRCTPKDGERSGQVKELISVGAVEAGPGVCTFDNRHAYTIKEAEWPSARVMSYNILADVYAQTELSKTVLYPYCAPYALQLDYRLNLIKKELAGYNADIICLQEVDKAVFTDSLTPTLDAFGLDGVFRVKDKQHEGLATFYRRSKFKLLSQHDIMLSEALSSEALHSELLERLSVNSALKEKTLQRSTTLQVRLFTCCDYRKVCVANTHLYFHPKGKQTPSSVWKLLSQ
uniref:Phosphodiesterase 12 n=1 Tax=Labrus bergylta TaxID=56723 RepID=A0A3Q3NL36_9LABR